MHILFKRRPGSSAIYCRITVNGIHATLFSTFIKVAPEDWDQKAQRIKGDTLAACDNNMRLDQIKSDVNRLFLQDNQLSAHELAALYLQKDKQIFYFSDIVDKFEKDCKITYRNPETLRSYLTRIGNVRAFMEDRKIMKIQANRITMSVAHDFVRFLKERRCAHAYIVRNVYVLKNITSNAASREIIKIDPFLSFKFKKREKINTNHLTKQELLTLETFDWRPNLQRIVDLFLFSCYTGLHYDDVQTLKESELKDDIDGRVWIIKPRGKYADSDFFGERVQKVPLHPKARILIEKYGSVENLPKISNDKYNDYLKQIQYMADIKIPLTVKIGRKTFTDILLNELNASEVTVAAVLGHSSTRFVKYYAQADERRIANEVQW